MVTETKINKSKKRNRTLKILKVEYVQVPDAQERLSRVFKILMSKSDDSRENEAKRR